MMTRSMNKKPSDNRSRFAVGAVLFLFGMAIFGVQVMRNIKFKQQVKGQLKLAADASTVDLAEQKLTLVLDYLKTNDLTTGYTSALYETPTEDISFWYQNLKASKEELAKVENSSQLEKTNTLLKLRETLMDGNGDGKAKVTYPEGLANYPNNLMYGLLAWLAVFAMLSSFYYLIPKGEWDKMSEAGKEKEEL